ncbi:5547_t:CDS:1, partial [Racocetra persica]
VYYFENMWTSISLCPSDRISSKQIKTQENISVNDLLVETLIREAKLSNLFEPTEVPLKFLTLVETCIIRKEREAELSTTSTNNLLWIDFGRWLGFKEPIKRRHVRRRLKHKWRKLQHALNLRSENSTNMIIESITRREKTRLIMSARENFQSLKNLVQFRYVVSPECITDLDGQTIIHLEQLDNYDAVIQATNAVDYYYFHTINNPSHRSHEFWANLIEHFGAYALYNILPYTSSNTASSHNSDHQICVNNLLQKLKPLSDSINQFFQDCYKNLYKKLNNLSWGPFAPRPFG